MTSRCHRQQSGPHKSVRASQESGVVRAMVLTPLATQQSGIPPPSSVLASLGRQVHPHPIAITSSLTRNQLSISRKFATRKKNGAASTSMSRKYRPSNNRITQMLGAEKMPGTRRFVQRSTNAIACPLKYLAAERSEDGVSGRYTTPWCSEWCQNHCSNHSGFLTGADTFVRTTLLAMAPGGHAISERLSFGYFSLARQRKVTAAPRRGDANRPTRSQVLHANREQTTKQTKPKPQSFPRSTSAPPRGSLPPPVCFSSHARRSSRGVTPNLSR